MFEQEFGALEAFRELLADGLLDDARSGEANKCFWLSDIQITEHGEAGGDTTGSGIGHEGDVGNFGVIKAAEGGGDFGELHERGDAFHHAGATGGGDDDERSSGAKCSIYSSCDGFANDGAHGSADKAVLHGAEDDGMAVQGADGVDDGIVQASLFLGFLEASLVGLKINKIKGIGGFEIEVDELVAAVEEVLDAGSGIDAEVVVTLGTNVLILKEIGLEDGLPATLTADPEAFGSDCFLFVGDDLMIFALKPGHRGLISCRCALVIVPFRAGRPVFGRGCASGGGETQGEDGDEHDAEVFKNGDGPVAALVMEDEVVADVVAAEGTDDGADDTKHDANGE